MATQFFHSVKKITIKTIYFKETIKKHVFLKAKHIFSWQQRAICNKNATYKCKFCSQMQCTKNEHTHQEVQYNHIHEVHQPRAFVVRCGLFYRCTVIRICLPSKTQRHSSVAATRGALWCDLLNHKSSSSTLALQDPLTLPTCFDCMSVSTGTSRSYGWPETDPAA